MNTVFIYLILSPLSIVIDIENPVFSTGRKIKFKIIGIQLFSKYVYIYGT